MCSLDASPVPSATHSRPGNISVKRRCGLSDDRRVVALPRRIDDPERQRRRGHRRPQPRPREARLTLPGAPRREVIRRHPGIEADLLRAASRQQQLTGRDLLMRRVPSDDRHRRADCPP